MSVSGSPALPGELDVRVDDVAEEVFPFLARLFDQFFEAGVFGFGFGLGFGVFVGVGLLVVEGVHEGEEFECGVVGGLGG